jgi:hypothetical protein
MTHLKDFTASIEKASKSEPMMQKWLYGTRELERQLSERLVHLCQYLDLIPQEALASYADVIAEALEDAGAEGTLSASSEDLMKSLIELVEILESSENPQMNEKGKRIRETIGK